MPRHRAYSQATKRTAEFLVNFLVTLYAMFFFVMWGPKLSEATLRYLLLRMHARLKEDLVGVNVSNTGEGALIHKPPLNRSAVSGSLFAKTIQVGIQSIGPEFMPDDEGMNIARQCDMAELALCDIRETVAIRKRDVKPRVSWQLAFVLEIFQAIGHAKVKHQPGSLVQGGEQIFTVPAGLLESTSPKGAFETAEGNPREHIRGFAID
jgi:hypothetical protein